MQIATRTCKLQNNRQNNRKDENTMKINIMTVAAVMLAATFAFAEDGDIVKVRGKGTGSDKTEALKDAYRDAVERAVGLYVDAEQMMKNEELVKDQILTQSNAYIEKYDVTKESAKPNGLVEVQILAEVRKTALTKKISDVMPTKTFKLNSAVVQNLHAKLVTDEKRTTDGAALLRNALDGIDPARQLVKASLVSPDAKIIEPNGRGRRNDGELVTLRYAFKFEIDCDRYMSEFLPHLQKTLEQVSVTEPKTIRLTAKHSEYRGEERVTFYGQTGGREISTSSRGGRDSKGTFTSVLLFTECDAKFAVAKARLYDLPEAAGKELAAWQRALAWDKNGAIRISYNVVVGSKDGREICVVPLSLCKGDLLPIAPSAQASRPGTAIIAPLVNMETASCLKWVDCKIPRDELPNVAIITIELAE